MTHGGLSKSVIALIEQSIPYLRRYARALSGSQEIGDAHAARVLRGIISGEVFFDVTQDVHVQLYRAFHDLFESGTARPEDGHISQHEAKIQEHLTSIDQAARASLLLYSIEGFSEGQIALIRGVEPSVVRADIRRAQSGFAKVVKGRVLIIEDDPLIALRLSDLVQGIGHVVTSLASNFEMALEWGESDPPDLILADIQLSDARTGLEAVHALNKKLGATPTIFVTALPELYLTGVPPEPAFLITKPFDDAQIRTAVGQALIFSSLDVLA